MQNHLLETLVPWSGGLAAWFVRGVELTGSPYVKGGYPSVAVRRTDLAAVEG